ncbi:MAG: amidophosphoribosyltransferase [Syntrophus sp. (in: bacteria)]|nr:amidophosphoribosyltransferase [Syntrophus sp. (in: bacteria)]
MKRFIQGLSDLVFPPRCMACGVLLAGPECESFCRACFSLVRFIAPPLCPCCGIPIAGADADHLCGDCILSSPPYAIARAVARYEAVLLDAIHTFKYKGKIATGEVLGKMMADHLYPGFSIADYSLIVPVPLHPKRLRERGFNQAVILAREISKRFSLPLDFLTLRRHVFTEPQVNLGRDQRTANVHGAFAVKNKKKIEGQKIILVDDVYTTGSTVKECAGMLMTQGAAEVAVLTLARAV